MVLSLDSLSIFEKDFLILLTHEYYFSSFLSGTWFFALIFFIRGSSGHINFSRFGILLLLKYGNSFTRYLAVCVFPTLSSITYLMKRLVNGIYLCLGLSFWISLVGRMKNKINFRNRLLIVVGNIFIFRVRFWQFGTFYNLLWFKRRQVGNRFSLRIKGFSIMRSSPCCILYSWNIVLANVNIVRFSLFLKIW